MVRIKRVLVRGTLESGSMRVYGMRTGISFSLSASDRKRLRAITIDPKSPQKHVWRARIVLFSGDGVGTNAIMAAVQLGKQA